MNLHTKLEHIVLQEYSIAFPNGFVFKLFELQELSTFTWIATLVHTITYVDQTIDRSIDR